MNIFTSISTRNDLFLSSQIISLLVCYYLFVLQREWKYKLFIWLFYGIYNFILALNWWWVWLWLAFISVYTIICFLLHKERTELFLKLLFSFSRLLCFLDVVIFFCYSACMVYYFYRLFRYCCCFEPKSWY